MTEEQIQQLVSEYMVWTLAESDKERVERGSQLIDCGDHFEPGIPYYEYTVSALTDVYEGTTEYIGPIVDNFLEVKGVQVEKDSFEYRKLCRDIALAHVESLEIEGRRDLGDFSDEYYGAGRKVAPASLVAESVPTKDEGITFAELVDRSKCLSG